MGEFELIRQFFQPLAAAGGSSQLLLGPGDDCAIQRVPPGRDLVFSVDTLVEGVHFPERYSPFNLGWRSLAVATSDLAAMGAAPVCFTLALTLPEANEDWLSDFAEGLAKAVPLLVLPWRAVTPRVARSHSRSRCMAPWRKENACVAVALPPAILSAFPAPLVMPEQPSRIWTP